MSFAESWKYAECDKIPDRIRKIRVTSWASFEHEVHKERESFVDAFVDSIYSGDAWILKGAFSRSFMERMKRETINWCDNRPESFHKMLDGVPDFHRRIDIETGKKYSIWACKHSAYFFRFNDDPLGLWPTVTGVWRVLKMAMGLRPNEWEDNKPSDGIVDRIQVVRYPPEIGYLEPHRDAYKHQRCFISGYMSKRGVDYEDGGFYFVDAEGKLIDAEDMIDVGDVCIGYANIVHGVAPCRGNPDWGNTYGRWFLGLYSNVSDHVEKRETAKPVRIELEGVRP